MRLRHGAAKLRDALREVVADVPAQSTKPREFARVLKAHRVVVGRLLKAVEYSDPLAALCEMPRAEGLRTILKASRACVRKEAIERASQAIVDLERLLDQEVGGWGALHSVASDWLPEARRKFEMANKQAAFKAMANLKGYYADTEFCAFIGYPDDTGERVDAALVAGSVGLRRLRPSAEICVTSLGAFANGSQAITMAGLAAPEASDEYPLLRRFCSSPPPQFKVVRTELRAHYLLTGNGVGPGSAVDVATACTMKGRHPRYQTTPPRRIAAFGDPTVPCKSLLIDMLLHEDVWPEAAPELIMYDTTQQDLANPNSQTGELYRLKVNESITYMGQGVARFRVAGVGHYVEMLQHVCDTLSWDASRLRGYRCHIRYPIYGTSACVVFDPPARPSANSDLNP
ncbi:MAG: hypothetical protein PVJ57_03810 [Phycisphaerae bacterium]